MIIEIRKTISGTEYWDTKEKRSLFVPTGETIAIDPVKEIMNLDLDNTPLGVNRLEDSDVTVINLNDMTVKQLRDHAASINVEIPADVKKKEDIIELLS
ncbi:MULTISPECIES: hypothetical protein [Bacillus cereus group]|uniref:hypothetical protein n=1 Tax=Bacillus cereus group TaxID=86661 RepID=UPI0018CD7176|nr:MULTISPECIES: hypothetical protein [Bacillus cereus group]MBG9840859.1 phage protein [Bacillus tropicus]MBG9880024.1 phage protein [Bacillus tropicus]MBG9923154.1 phage protein [Bacillus tropicus]MBJ8356206.1 hypothetical protein [Bacillus mycoides]MED2903322.1 hypothetical protein [Bacillus tropicus]